MIAALLERIGKLILLPFLMVYSSIQRGCEEYDRQNIADYNVGKLPGDPGYLTARPRAGTPWDRVDGPLYTSP